MESTSSDGRRHRHRDERDNVIGSSTQRRSRSPHNHRVNRGETVKPVRLPFGQSQLRKRDYDAYFTLFADYLDLQKQLELSSLSETEAKGRWKSFMGKWNRCELSEGWYDPKTKERADAHAAEERSESRVNARPHTTDNRQAARISKTDAQEEESDDGGDDDDDGFGPSLPAGSRPGPQAPTTQELQLRRELETGDREHQNTMRKLERKEERSNAQSRLDELTPRAAAGTHDRQIEKRREQAFSNKTFAESKDAGVAEVPESDLLGATGVEEYKAEVQKNQRKQSEREIRKEEVLRARAVEREEKVAEFRRKEDKTMEMLRGLARERFGAGG
ncbi:hypothetical protein B0A48_04121 [Cryoendolithus antarcticus]|uniref:Uncharacterized protein n=1 Tax=Cryoendolithus antarcticus TaxID=1507870 RepID=A0A1V8THV9_9PEZI|nr:hypothetical protein B0A48_04121 [Cryoendolithus antarcticus]